MDTSLSIEDKEINDGTTVFCARSILKGFKSNLISETVAPAVQLIVKISFRVPKS